MRVLFLQENGLSESIGLCCLSAYLKREGHECDLLILSHTVDVYESIRQYKPDILGFTSFTGMHKSLFRLIKSIGREVTVPIVVGGPHPTFYPEECFQECPEIDMICRGEGEEALLGLVDALRDGVDYTGIKGLWVRVGNEIKRNSIASPVKNVTELPMPDRMLYYKYKFLRDFPMKRFISGYGCPYKCTYCNEPFLKNELAREDPENIKYFMRRKAVDQVIDEILHVRSISRIKRVHFSDDLFATDTRWLEEFSRKYAEKVGLPFSCNLRFDSINERRADLLKKALCYAVQSGIETGNEGLRNIVINKNLPDKMIFEGAGLLRSRDIKIYTTNIVALPGETIQEALETIQINRRIDADFIRVNTLIPFPKTQIADYAVKNGYLPDDYSLRHIDASDSLHIHCKTPYENEFKNIACLFLLLVKIPFPNKLILFLLRIKNNFFYRALGLLNLLQDVRYFKIGYWAAFSFFVNVYLKAGGDVTMHWIPGMKSKTTADAPVENSDV